MLSAAMTLMLLIVVIPPQVLFVTQSLLSVCLCMRELPVLARSPPHRPLRFAKLLPLIPIIFSIRDVRPLHGHMCPTVRLKSMLGRPPPLSVVVLLLLIRCPTHI